MRKLLNAILIAAFVLISVKAFADLQYQNNGTNIGIATKANLVGCTATRAGEIVTINCQNVTGPMTVTGSVIITGNETVSGTSIQGGQSIFNGGIGTLNWPVPDIGGSGINWMAIPQGYKSGINWIGADILARGMNWTDIRAYGTGNGGDHSGINWQSFGV
jgi:hypothetical protein